MYPWKFGKNQISGSGDVMQSMKSHVNAYVKTKVDADVNVNRLWTNTNMSSVRSGEGI